MKSRNWLWFVASALLAILAGVLAMVLLRPDTTGGPAIAQQTVVVARAPIAMNEVIRADYVMLQEMDVTDVPSMAFVAVSDLVGEDKTATALRDIAQGEVILAGDVYIPEVEAGVDILGDQVAVALPAQDILSKWGAILPGDHVDVLITMDVILEKPMYPEDVRTMEELELYSIERDQSMDNVSVLTLQNLEVLQIIEEPASQTQQEEDQPVVRNRALVLKAEPQDAVVLRYLLDVVNVAGNGSLTLAKRSSENEALFNVQPVNINYLMLRYGVVLPQPLE